MPKDLSHEELYRAYLDLQARVTRFSAKEQELINVRDQLDHELVVHRRMNDFHAAAIDVHDVPEFLALVAESVVDLFETEVGYAAYHALDEPENILDHAEGPLRQEQQLSALKASVHHGPGALGVFDRHLFEDRQRGRSDARLVVVGAVGVTRKHTYPSFNPKTSSLFRLFAESCLAYLENILANKRINEQYALIRQSELEQRRLSVIATQTDSGVIITDSHGQIEWVNKAFTQNTGYGMEEVLGHKPKMFLQEPGLNDEAVLNTLSNALAHKENVSVTLKNRKKNGEVFYIRLTITPVFDEQGNHINFIAIQQDITTEKLNEARLIEQNEELTKINQELDQFVYSTSHDLRSPLLSIQGLLDLMEGVEGANKAYLDLISESVKRLDSTILEILNYSRNARLEVEGKAYNLKQQLQDILQDQSNLNPQVHVDIEWLGEEGVCLDELRVGILLKNILSNAVKYSKTGGQDPWVRVRVDTRDNRCLMVVEDNGEGIDKAHQPKIFDMFYRATTSSTGTGLGLYIVKEIVSKLNGSVTLESEKDVGTTVTVNLPQHEHLPAD